MCSMVPGRSLLHFDPAYHIVRSCSTPGVLFTASLTKAYHPHPIDASHLRFGLMVLPALY